MKRIRDRVAGLDVHRDTVVACCRVAGPGDEVEVTKQSFSTTQRGLTELAGFLGDARIETVAMEATGVYWKSVYYALEGLFPELWLCNAAHVKNVPDKDRSLRRRVAGRCGRARHGAALARPTRRCASYASSRDRKTQVDARVREIQRLEKTLQDAGIKLTSVASSVWSLVAPHDRGVDRG